MKAKTRSSGFGKRITGTAALAIGLLGACAPAESEQPSSSAPSVITEPGPRTSEVCAVASKKLGPEYRSSGDKYEIEKMLGNWGPENSQIAWGDMRVAFAIHLIDHPIPSEPNLAYRVNVEVTSGPNASAEQALATARKLGSLAGEKLALEDMRLIRGQSTGSVSQAAQETVVIEPVMLANSPNCRPLDAQDF